MLTCPRQQHLAGVGVMPEAEQHATRSCPTNCNTEWLRTCGAQLMIMAE